MSHPHYHSKSSARRFGGVASDYHALHEWFDQVKAHLPDVRHRAVLHSSFGIFLAQQVFGEVIVRKSDGVEVPTRLVGEQHVLEDLGFIPTVQDWLKGLPMRAWMIKGAKAIEADASAPARSVMVRRKKQARKSAASKSSSKPASKSTNSKSTNSKSTSSTFSLQPANSRLQRVAAQQASTRGSKARSNRGSRLKSS